MVNARASSLEAAHGLRAAPANLPKVAAPCPSMCRRSSALSRGPLSLYLT